MFLSLCWLLVAIAYEAEGLVGNNFTECSDAFFNREMPVGFEGIAKPHDFKQIPDGITRITDLASPAYICQTLGGRSYYATLYDRGRRIPLYSAYILDKKSTESNPECKRTSSFNLEPQLIYREVTENMQNAGQIKQTIKAYNFQNQIKKDSPKNWPHQLMNASQAVDYDYRGNKDNYNKGHLNPCGHHNDLQNYLSTFTLTNVVPMKLELNGGVWNQYEKEMIGISKGCGKMYVVTGSVPGNNVMKGRVNIPSYVWNAYCCVDNLGKPIKSGGAIAANDKALAPNNNFKVEKMELGALQIKLITHLKLPINSTIFACDCKERKGNMRCNSV